MFKFMKKKSTKIKQQLLALIVLSFFVFSIYMVTLQQFNITSNSKDVANNIAVQLSETIIEKTFNFLMPAMLISETSANLMQSGILSSKNLDLIERSSLNFIKPHHQLSNFYFADMDGNFVMVSKQNDLFTETRLQKEDSPNQVELIKRNQQGQIISRESQPSTFVPSERPWFIGAVNTKKQFWTNLYVFHSKKYPGITASFPVIDKTNSIIGVFGVDIELQDVSSFLDGQIKNYAATALILDKENNIVAKPGELTFDTDIDGTIKPISKENLNDKFIQTAINLYEKNNKTSFNFEYKNQMFNSFVRDFPSYFGKSWKIVILLSNQNNGIQPSFSYIFLASILIGLILFITVTYKLLIKVIRYPIQLLDKSISISPNEKNSSLEKEFIKMV